MRTSDIDALFDTDNTDTSPNPGEEQDAAEEEEIFGDIEQAPKAKSRGNGTLTIGKKTYAIGLTWNFADNSGRAKKEAKAAAKEDRGDFFCVRPGDIAQYGIGDKAMGHKAGMLALMDILCAHFEGNWLGVFEVGQLYYIAAARGGQILTACDKLYYDEADAREDFMALMSSSDWDHLMAPKRWGAPDTEDVNLRAIKLRSKGCKLVEVNPTGTVVVALLLTLVIVGAAGGGYYWVQKEEADALQDAARARAAKEDQIRGMLDAVKDTVAPVLGIEEAQEENETPPDPPWVRYQNGPGTIIVCVDDILTAPDGVPGWETSMVSCGQGNVSTSFNNVGGTVPWAEYYLRQNGFPELDLSRSAMSTSLSVSQPSSFVSNNGASIETASLEKVRRHLLFSFEELGREIKWQQQPNNPSDQTSRYYKQASFSFESEEKPTEFLPLLSPIPALAIDSVSFDASRGLWSVRGQVFEKREHPLPKPQSDEEVFR